MRKLVSAAAFLAGLLFFLEALVNFFILFPGAKLIPAIWSVYFAGIASQSALYALTAWGVVIPTLLAVAVVLEISDHLRPLNETWMRWATTLVVVGYAIAMIKEITDMTTAMHLAQIYIGGDPMAQAALQVIEHHYLDPDLVLEALMIAIWFLVSSLLILRSPEDKLPDGLAYLGLAYVGAFVLLGLALLVDNQTAFLWLAGLQMILIGPAWFVFAGFYLSQENIRES